MNSKRKSFVIHKDSLQVLEDLPIDVVGGELFLAIKDYQLGNKVVVNGLSKVAFSIFKIQFEKDDERYERTSKARSEAGSMGGKQKLANASNCKQMLPIDSNSKQMLANATIDISDGKIPSIQEVESYAKEYAARNKKDEAQCIALAVKGYNNYIDNKWRDVNDNPIIRWKSKLQNSYLSLEKLNDAIDLEEDRFNKSMQWLCSINRMYEDVGYCKRTYESKLSSGVNDDYVPHLKNVLEYKKII